MKKKLSVFLVIVSVICINISLANLVNNGDFSSPSIPLNTADGSVNCLGDTWFKAGESWGLYNPETVTAPLAGQVMFCNGDPSQLQQTFAGVSLQPNNIYILTFDAYSSLAGPHTINAGFYHGIGSGTNSRITAVLNMSDIDSVTVSNGTWWGAAWSGGAQFTTLTTPPANDPSIYHELKIVTGDTITGIGDLGVIFWEESGVQMIIDNVKVEVVPEPAILGFIGLLVISFLRRK